MSKDRELLQKALVSAHDDPGVGYLRADTQDKLAEAVRTIRIDARLAEPQGDAGRLADELDAMLLNGWYEKEAYETWCKLKPHLYAALRAEGPK